MKPSLPQGTRDFSASVVRRRNYIFNSIRSVFELYGYQPLETPAMEQLETLMGKYGEEGDKLIFKILNNGLDNPTKESSTRSALDEVMKGRSSKNLTERALRYDLTIPFARYVAMNAGSITMPFKRYQIQPVWRADRPQRGRYREFYQCDADVVGSKSLLNEAELVHIYNTVFGQLSLSGFRLSINSRKILAALAERCGGSDKMMDITIAIDKLDKIGIEKVQEELASKGLSQQQIEIITQFLSITGNNEQKLKAIHDLLGEKGRDGMNELTEVIRLASAGLPDTSFLQIDFTLARGLNYYTGIIFEAKAPSAVKIGSIGGGGRYDDLTGLFGVPNIAGVGISFGVDRIYDVLEELNLFPADLEQGATVLFFNLGKEEALKSFQLLQTLRSNGIPGEIFHEEAKFDKQFKYAEKKGIAYAVIIGSKELDAKKAIIKQLSSGKQEEVDFDGLLRYFSGKTIV